MSQRSSSQPPTSRNRSSESTTRNARRPRTTTGRTNPTIQEECITDDQEQVCEEEREFEFPTQEPRYDPKELRDAAKILSPFLRMLEDSYNPYARLVARELCKTFYHLFHPGMHPVDVMKRVDWNSKFERTNQLWNEFWLYVPGARPKEWVTLKGRKDLNEFNGTRDENRARDTNRHGAGPSGSQQCPDGGPRNQTNRTRQPSECRNNEVADDFQECPNLFDVSPPENFCEHQCAGSDSPALSCAADYKPDAASSSVSLKAGDQTVLDSIVDKIFESQSELERMVVDDSQKCFIIPVDADGENKAGNHCASEQHDSSERQSAGNDDVNDCSDSTPVCNRQSESADNPSQSEYYRVAASMPLPPRQQEDVANEPESRIIDLIDCDELEDFDDYLVRSEESEKNVVVEYHASLVANAFTKLSLAERDLQRKRIAYRKMAESYAAFAKNPIELDPPCPENLSARQILEAIHQIPPRVFYPFNDCEWNDNVLRDREFVQLLPFFETFHNQLEYISCKQREFGLDMLDDIMCILYHIHYDLGDPRLKNDMLVEHAKLVVKNTWEHFFYPGDRQMPSIPELPPPYYPESPQPEAFEQQDPLPTASGSRRSSTGTLPPPPPPVQPKRKPPPKVKVAPKAPAHDRPSGHGTSDPANRPPIPDANPPRAAANRRPRPGTSTQRTTDAPPTSSDPCTPPAVPQSN